MSAYKTEIIAELLITKNLRIAVAESCTGGLIAHELTNIPGSSNYFDSGIVVYSNTSKIQLLSIPEEVIKDYGAVSEKVAILMAENIRKLSKSDIGLATTGIAGPAGGTDDKPVGLVYVGINYRDVSDVRKHIFTGNRLINKVRFSEAALDLLQLKLQGVS